MRKLRQGLFYNEIGMHKLVVSDEGTFALHIALNIDSD